MPQKKKRIKCCLESLVLVEDVVVRREFRNMGAGKRLL